MEGIIYRKLYDDDGAIISLDGKTLLKVPDVPRYRVPEGIEEIDIKAFKNRPHLKEIDIPYTVEWYTDYPMSNDAMRYAPKGLKVNYWNWPYPENCDDEVFIDDKDVVYTIDRKRLLYARKGFTDNEYFVPEGTLTICDQAFFTENVQNALSFL